MFSPENARDVDRFELSEIPDYCSLDGYLSHYAKTTATAEAAADHGGLRLTYAELKGAVDRFQLALLGRGFRLGDRVAVLSPPHTDFLISFLAVVGLGGVWLGLNPRYTREEMGLLLQSAKPRFIFSWPELSGRSYLEDLAYFQSFPSSPAVILLKECAGQTSAAFINLNDFLSYHYSGSASELAKYKSQVDAESPCMLVFTSGTSGRPKGALLRQSGLVACSRMQAHIYGVRDSRTVNPLPINHVGCICDTATTTLVMGGFQVFVPQFDPGLILNLVKRERLTSLGGVPTMLQVILSHPSARTTDFSSLRRILWSGAPLPWPVASQLARLGVPMQNFYGMTETTGSLTFTLPEDDLATAVETIGRPAPGYEIRIANIETGEACPFGVIGEIQARAPGLLHSYLDDPAATADAFTADGWYRTGDLGEQRTDGYLLLRGRMREMFKSGGYNVYPREVEIALETLPLIAASCVVAVPDTLYHEVGYAFVVPSQPGVTAAGIVSQLRTKLANYKIPKFVDLVDELPILSNGKIDRTKLRDRALAQRGGS